MNRADCRETVLRTAHPKKLSGAGGCEEKSRGRASLLHQGKRIVLTVLTGVIEIRKIL
jgi:hypothetical protein